MEDFVKKIIDLEFEKIKKGTDIRPKILELLEEFKYECYKEGYYAGYDEGYEECRNDMRNNTDWPDDYRE